MMNEFFPWLIALAGAGASWYCYRWGREKGHADGYARGLADRRAINAADGAVGPNAVGGPGAVPR